MRHSLFKIFAPFRRKVLRDLAHNARRSLYLASLCVMLLCSLLRLDVAAQLSCSSCSGCSRQYSGSMGAGATYTITLSGGCSAGQIVQLDAFVMQDTQSGSESSGTYTIQFLDGQHPPNYVDIATTPVSCFTLDHTIPMNSGTTGNQGMVQFTCKNSIFGCAFTFDLQWSCQPMGTFTPSKSKQFKQRLMAAGTRL
jgi:hypothetical protein